MTSSNLLQGLIVLFIRTLNLSSCGKLNNSVGLISLVNTIKKIITIMLNTILDVTKLAFIELIMCLVLL